MIKLIINDMTIEEFINDRTDGERDRVKKELVRRGCKGNPDLALVETFSTTTTGLIYTAYMQQPREDRIGDRREFINEMVKKNTK